MRYILSVAMVAFLLCGAASAHAKGQILFYKVIAAPCDADCSVVNSEQRLVVYRHR